MNKNKIIITIFVTAIFYLIAANHYLFFPFHNMKMSEEERADIFSKVNDTFIKDSKIYDIKLGDSLLEKYSISEILEHQNNFHPNTNFIQSSFYNLSKTLYESIEVGYKKNDKNYIVHYIGGNIFYPKDLEKCYSRKEAIINSLTEYSGMKNWENTRWGDDEGMYDIDQAKLNSGQTINIQCVNWNNATEKNLGYTDALRIYLESEEWAAF